VTTSNQEEAEPGLVQLLDVCFMLLNKEKDGLGVVAARMVESNGFLALLPIMVYLHACGGDARGICFVH
jgi:hypothetical protein